MLYKIQKGAGRGSYIPQLSCNSIATLWAVQAGRTMKGRLTRAQTTRSDTISCKGQLAERLQLQLVANCKRLQKEVSAYCFGVLILRVLLNGYSGWHSHGREHPPRVTLVRAPLCISQAGVCAWFCAFCCVGILAGTHMAESTHHE